MKRILLIGLFFIGITFSPFANNYAQIKEEYELQERCGKRAEERFRQAYGNETTAVSYTNHYNRRLNKCLILVRVVVRHDSEVMKVPIPMNLAT